MNLYKTILTVSTPEEFESHTTRINAVSVLRKSSCRKCKKPSSVSRLPRADNSLRRRIRNQCCCSLGRIARPPPAIQPS